MENVEARQAARHMFGCKDFMLSKCIVEITKEEINGVLTLIPSALRVARRVSLSSLAPASASSRLRT